MAKVDRIRIRLVRSPISEKPQVRKTVRALGLRKLHSSVVQAATPPILGMVRAVSHLVEVEELSASRSSS
jgi:large subunit ribosomal protein L30